MRAGAIPVPLNVKLPAESLAFIARDADLSLLFVDAAHREVAPAVPAVDFDAGYAELLKPGPFDAVPPAPGDVCLQPYTSGSTGRPKGVLLTHAGQAWQIEALVRARRMTPEDRVLVAAPLYHKNALVWTKVGLAAGSSHRAAGALRPAPLRGGDRTPPGDAPLRRAHHVPPDPERPRARRGPTSRAVRAIGRGVRAGLARALRGAAPRVSRTRRPPTATG